MRKVEGIRACGTCGARYGESPDPYQIAKHTDERAVDRAARLTAGSISLDALAGLPDEIRCPSLRAIVATAVDLIVETAEAGLKECPVVTPTAAEILRRSLDKRSEA